MSSNTEQAIYDKNKQRRVIIFRRDDGTFFYEEEFFSSDEYEKCWIPKKRQMIGIYDSQQTAMREAVANIDWLRNERSTGTE